jgi:hypothetical protein
VTQSVPLEELAKFLLEGFSVFGRLILRGKFNAENAGRQLFSEGIGAAAEKDFSYGEFMLRREPLRFEEH